MAEQEISPNDGEAAQCDLTTESLTSGGSNLSTVDLSAPHCLLPALIEGESPQGKLFDQGAHTLSLAELLSILIGTEDEDPSVPLHLARDVLMRCTEGAIHPLAYFRHLTAYEIMSVEGVTPLKAAALIAAIEFGKRVFHPTPPPGTLIEDPEVAVSAFSADLMWAAEERFAALFLDVKHRIIARKVITIGSTTETIAYPRDIFGEALRHRATRIIVAHNHPSGDLTPSREDMALTRLLLESGRFLGVPVLDHLILGHGSSVSIRQTTTLWGDTNLNRLQGTSIFCKGAWLCALTPSATFSIQIGMSCRRTKNRTNYSMRFLIPSDHKMVCHRGIFLARHTLAFRFAPLTGVHERYDLALAAGHSEGMLCWRFVYCFLVSKLPSLMAPNQPEIDAPRNRWQLKYPQTKPDPGG